MSAQEAGRDEGIDMLRVLSMFMIVCLHVISQGGVMVRYADNHATYNVVWLVESLAFCAVNCYGLTSGWVGVKARHKMGRILELWLTVFFYTAGITLLAAVTGWTQVTRDVWVSSLLPVTWKTYWYFSAYVALFFLMPYLNQMVLSLTQRQRRTLMWTLFLIFSVSTTYPKIFSVDFLSLIGGYSLIWLIVLYVFGACLRMNVSTLRPHKRRAYVLNYFALTLVSWAFKVVCERVTQAIFGEMRYARLLLTYTSPTMLGAAICLLLAFSGLSLSSVRAKKALRYLASTCFSVYLIHAQPVIWKEILKNAFSSYARMSPWLVAWAIVLSALAIYVLCTLIDLLRLGVFQLLHVRARCDRLIEWLKMARRS